MTVIVAARCRDGAVIGADSQSTEMTAQVKWQVDKLFPLGSSMVWGASGQTAIIAELRSTLDSSIEILEKSPALHRSVQNLLQPEIERQYKRFLSPPGMQPQTAATGAVICGTRESGPFIIEVEPNGLCAELDRDWYATGSGAGFAYSAGSMLEHLGLRNRSVAQGTLMVFRALRAVISTSMFGVGEPIQIWQVTAEFGCKLLDEAAIKTLDQQLSALQEIEQDGLARVVGEGSGPEEALPEAIEPV